MLRAAAVAMGHDALIGSADEAEATGDFERAARFTWLGFKLGEMGRAELEVAVDLLYRTVDLLEVNPRRDEEATQEFEKKALAATWVCDLLAAETNA